MSQITVDLPKKHKNTNLIHLLQQKSSGARCHLNQWECVKKSRGTFVRIFNEFPEALLGFPRSVGMSTVTFSKVSKGIQTFHLFVQF